jgi:hypothetical protein
MRGYRSLTASIQFEPPRSTAGIAVLLGDLAVIAGLVMVGLLSHNIPDPWQYPGYLLSRITPFMLGWLIVAPFFGLFGDDRLGSYRNTVAFLLPAWICAAVVGATVRAVATSGGAGPVFVAVMSGFGLLTLLPWRLTAVALHRRFGT